jgi:eukaryotic-like serine/threonine-protein kinase
MLQHMDRIKRHATTLSPLGPEIPRPLAAICKTATHPVQELRFQSALALADDVERFLANEQISVLRDSIATRGLRWMRKHPTATVASAVSMLLLLMFSIVGITVLSDFNRRLSTSNTTLENANLELARANASEKEARNLADVNFESAKDAVEQFLVKVTEDPRVTSADFTDLRKDLLGAAQPFFVKLRDQEPGDQRVESSRAEALFRLAFIQESTGQEELAKRNFEQCASIYSQLSTESPSTVDYRINLAKCLSNLGLLLERLGEHEDARSNLQQAIAVRERLSQEFPRQASHRIEQVRASIGIQSSLRTVGDLAGAKSQGDMASAISEQLVAEFPSDPECREAFAMSLATNGMLLNQLGERENARSNLENAVSIRDGLSREFPDVTEYRITLAKSHHNLGFVLGDLGQRKAAIAEYEIALSLNDQLSRSFPTVTEYRKDLLGIRQNIGNLQLAMGERSEALKHLEAAAAGYLQLSETYRSVPSYAISLGGCYCNLGNFWMSNDQPLALQWYSKAASVLKPVFEMEPRDTKARSFLRNAHGGRASVLNMMNRFSEAAEDWKLASELDEGPNKAFFDVQAIQCETMAKQAEVFERILAGEIVELDDADQRAAFAVYCHSQKHYVKAAQQYQQALHDKPELAAANRYNAACSTALALANTDANEPWSAEQRSAWRSQALE